MGFLWAHLDRDVDESKVRRQPGSAQQDHVRKLAEARLHGNLQASVLRAVEAADAARARRNAIVHQDWVLRGRDAMRPVADFAHLDGPAFEAYRVEWEREAMDSAAWQRVPHDSIEVVPAQTLDELRDVERALSRATDEITALTFAVASARECGAPEGWLSPSNWTPYTTPARVAKPRH